MRPVSLGSIPVIKLVIVARSVGRGDSALARATLGVNRRHTRNIKPKRRVEKTWKKIFHPKKSAHIMTCNEHYHYGCPRVHSYMSLSHGSLVGSNSVHILIHCFSSYACPTCSMSLHTPTSGVKKACPKCVVLHDTENVCVCIYIYICVCMCIYIYIMIHQCRLVELAPRSTPSLKGLHCACLLEG